MANNLILRLLQGRLRVPSNVREVLQIQRPPPRHLKRQTWKRPPKYIKGVSNGNYFRIKIPPKKKRLPDVPKLPPTIPMPKPFNAPPPSPQKVVQVATAQSSEKTRKRVIDWFKGNLPIVILNIGSVCTLVGFTRSDVLELRSLAITGNVLFVFYNLGQNPILWPSIAWSSLFALVNGVKIFEILHERNAEVHMTEKQEGVFVEHFMPHGITPKQFERIDIKAKTFRLKKGEFLFRKGEKLDRLYLIVEGSTHAHILGRHLTAASTNADTKGDQKAGGDSGAWVGEMAFLEGFWEKRQIIMRRIKSGQQKETKDAVKEENGVPKKGLGLAIYTILADEDCTVMSWSFEEMEDLMQGSTDLRAALTRAMTSALVGKVVNLTVSRTQGGILPHWSNWLSDWKHNDGAKVQVKNIQRLPEDKSEVTEATKLALA